MGMFKSCEDYPDIGLRKGCNSHLDTPEGKTPKRNGDPFHQFTVPYVY